MYLRSNGGRIYTSGIELLHKSQGTVTPDFYECAYRLAEKYAKSFDDIATTCVIIGTNPLFIRVFSELQDYIKNNGYLEKENTKLASMIGDLIERNRELEQQLRTEHSRSLSFEQNISTLHSTISELEKQLRIEHSHSISLEQNLTSIFNSRSWRVTASLRNFTAIIKRSKIKRAIYKVVNSYKVYGFKSTLYKIFSKCTSVKKSVNIFKRKNNVLFDSSLIGYSKMVES